MKTFIFLVALLMAGCATTDTSGRVYSGALEQQRVQVGHPACRHQAKRLLDG